MIEYIPCQVQLIDVFGQSPGDPCPDDKCTGELVSIEAKWTSDSFTADAICGTCGSAWTLVEIPTLGDILAAEDADHPIPYNVVESDATAGDNATATTSTRPDSE